MRIFQCDYTALQLQVKLTLQIKRPELTKELTMSALSPVVTYDPAYKKAFKDLNVEWIEKYFQVEKKDSEQLNNPEQCLEGGGQIFFVLDDAEPVATCAIYKHSEDQYELAKMAVRPDQQGRGLSNLLMQAAEDYARAQGAKEMLILSNTVLTPAITLYKKYGYVTSFLGDHPVYQRCNIEMKKSL